MKKIKYALVSLIALLGVVAVVPVVPQSAYAAEQCSTAACTTIQNGVNSVGGDAAGNSTSLALRIKDIVNVLLFIIGAIAVIMIIIGGFRYVTSGGEAGSIKNAKNTILYAVVGLVIAIFAYAIVNFVITSFK